MRLSPPFIVAAAIFAAAPAIAQNAAENAATAENTMTATTNADANAAVPATPETTAAVPGNEAAIPPYSTTPEDAGRATVTGSKRGFPWGVFGILGLIGLLGRRRTAG